MTTTPSPRPVAAVPDHHVDDADTRLHALVDDHRTALFSHARRLTGGDAAWAEDVVQEAFVRAWRHLDRMTPDHGSVRSWLLRVVHNLVMDGYRAARCRPALAALDDTCVVPIADDSAEVLTRLEVHDLLAILPEPHRLALVETYLNDRTTAEAAAVLGVPVGTVKSRVYYAMRTLRSSVVAERLTA